MQMVEQNRSSKQGVLLFAEIVSDSQKEVTLELHFHIKGVHLWTQKIFALDQTYWSWRNLALNDALPFVPLVEDDSAEEQPPEQNVEDSQDGQDIQSELGAAGDGI